MMDITNTLKGLLPKIGFTWNTLLRLFYSLCGWLVIGTTPLVDAPAGSTPIGVLRRLLDRLGAPSSFTFGMEDWCGSHACLLTMSGLVVLAVSILATAAVASGGAWGEVFAGLEAPVFLFGLSPAASVRSPRPAVGSLHRHRMGLHRGQAGLLRGTPRLAPEPPVRHPVRRRADLRLPRLAGLVGFRLVLSAAHACKAAAGRHAV